jgi:transcriptional regulator with XRE-family HTH domain
MTERKRRQPLKADHVGARLSEWRTRRRESQLDLAISANISQRHLSFVESGRTLPSREMVIRLCDALDVPLRARNELMNYWLPRATRRSTPSDRSTSRKWRACARR